VATPHIFGLMHSGALRTLVRCILNVYYRLKGQKLFTASTLASFLKGNRFPGRRVSLNRRSIAPGRPRQRRCHGRPPYRTGRASRQRLLSSKMEKSNTSIAIAPGIGVTDRRSAVGALELMKKGGQQSPWKRIQQEGTVTPPRDGGSARLSS
jgi:hypothetical protein